MSKKRQAIFEEAARALVEGARVHVVRADPAKPGSDRSVYAIWTLGAPVLVTEATIDGKPVSAVIEDGKP